MDIELTEVCYDFINQYRDVLSSYSESAKTECHEVLTRLKDNLPLPMNRVCLDTEVMIYFKDGSCNRAIIESANCVNVYSFGKFVCTKTIQDCIGWNEIKEKENEIR